MRLLNALLGASAGALMLPLTLFGVGLSAIGPVAGGLFASWMGPGVTSGSIMAVAQSLAMGGSTGLYATIVGALSSAGAYLGSLFI